MNIFSRGLFLVPILTTSLFLPVVSSAKTISNTTANSQSSIAPNSQPLLIAKTRNYCRQGESLFVSAETRGFWVNICGGDAPYTYVGVDKRNGRSIRLPLRDYDQQGNYFEAVNGEYTYLLVRGTNKGDFLTVTRRTKEILRQPILNWD